MIMSYLWTGMVLLSCVCAILSGNGSALSAAVLDGAQSGITLAMAIAGGLCLWSGVGKLLEAGGVTAGLSRLLMPLIGRIFPTARKNKKLAASLSGNICANFLGLGNAATPMGIAAAKALAHGSHTANDELCRLIVLNTASIQLIPGNVAAVRSSLGCSTPFDILPAVWVTSLLSASAGVFVAMALGRIFRD